MNAALFEWVIENLCKNAIDALQGQGNIDISVSDLSQHVQIDIKDTGKGIPKSMFTTIFKPGFTTKKKGWGLGLSLVKRIVEEYHEGKIFVSQSELNKGSVFRIILRK
jgi:two-component system, sporulation sensor kinase D